ncbi:MAG: endonuclease/exonuclease/phosphatase family metal-dependent hydrolase [Planctomycetota bacterium]|jgi:endonuclease/exonuclease/phosphatase family metal-dependent hydrolase
MMLRSVLLFVSLCFALPAQVAADIRIGSWNIEFLGADPKYRRDTPPRSDEDRIAIGKKVKELGVAVLGVQEICGEEPLKAVAAAAGPSWRAVLGTTGKWSDNKTQQGVGFVYDSIVVDLLYAEELLEFPSELDGVSVFHRKPVTACFRHRKTGCDFRVVIVHLKAGRKARDLQKRKAEATHLREWVGKLLVDPKEDRDIVIMGDFNSTYGDDPEKMLESGGVMQYLDHQATAPTIMHFDTPIDQFCVGQGFREVQRNSFVSHHVSGAKERLLWRKTYSDHFPVTLRMTPLADDDPGSTFRRGPREQILPTMRRKPATINLDGAQWPLKKGTRVLVRGPGMSKSGKLIRLPVERGWVVIETEQGIRAYPMEQVHSIEVLKQ